MTGFPKKQIDFNMAFTDTPWIMEMYKEKVEKEKIAVRFACRQIAPPEVGS